MSTGSDAAAAARAEDLRRVLNRASHQYYILDQPEISDAEYDRLLRELQAIETAHPYLRTPDSPTLRVGTEPATELAKHRHRVPMLSLANAFDEAELEAWETRNARVFAAVRAAGYTTEIKIDGAAVSLTYEDGILKVGATRGNGEIGEDITANLRTIPDVPLTLHGPVAPRFMEVRGEVYFPKDQFAKLNERRAAEGEPQFANPRNAAAGGVRQLDPAATRERGLRFFAFHVETTEPLPVNTQRELLELLAAWGFPVAPHWGHHPSLTDVHAAVARLESILPGLNFQADGVVVKVDRLDLHPELGIIGGREPRWAIARKFAPQVVVTRLHAIGINVGRTGALNPFAILEPINVTGVTVSMATLHNLDLILAKDIRIGDWVEVTRAGEVIPQVLGPVRDKRTGSERVFAMPDVCPRCGAPVEHPADEVTYYCPNISCPGRVLEGIVHFASRGAMDIRGLGYSRVAQLLEAGLIQNVGDLFDLSPLQLETLEGFAEKSAAQLVRAISDARDRPLSRLLFGLGIRHVGAGVAALLAREFRSMDALRSAAAEAINAVEGIGAVIAEAVVHFFADGKNQALLAKLAASGLRMTEPVDETGEGPLAGQTYVITGTLPSLARSRAEGLITGAGGKVVGSVSRKTTAVLAGADPGSKLDRARALGVPVIDEAELLRRLGEGP